MMASLRIDETGHIVPVTMFTFYSGQFRNGKHRKNPQLFSFL